MSIKISRNRSRIVLAALAIVIITYTFWYTTSLISSIKNDEQKKVKLWIEAIQQKAKLVQTTNEIFNQLSEDEYKKVDLWKDAVNILADSESNTDLSFAVKVIQNNTNVPILLVNEKGDILQNRNLDPKRSNDEIYLDSMLLEMKKRYPPIVISYDKTKKNYLYYMNSNLFTQLEKTMDELIESFISETVINVASVPVVITDSTKTKVIKYGKIDSVKLNPKNLKNTLAEISKENKAQIIRLSNDNFNYIFYEESDVLQKIRRFPIFQISAIALFLLLLYVFFNFFRRVEQNSVWVGMAKETAHQLGTPLSSLMAWIELLKDDLPESTTIELEKDVNRLKTVTDRFSKIGSEPKLNEEDIEPILNRTYQYLKTRISKKINFTLQTESHKVLINPSLFDWVLENLCKNSIDAMKGKEGELSITSGLTENILWIEVKDTGEGIHPKKLKTVFEPGYTTKERGWGLGLSLSKRIINEYHKGKIFVKNSAPGVGTTFRIEFYI